MAKQELYITGWGDTKFNDALQNASFVEHIFGEKLPSFFIRPLQVDEDFRTFPIFALSNRFFTPQDSVPYEHLTPFSVLVDPCQHLYSYGWQSTRPLVNISENTVDYSQFVQGTTGIVNRCVNK